MFGSQNRLNDFANHLAKDNFYFNAQLSPKKGPRFIWGLFSYLLYML